MKELFTYIENHGLAVVFFVIVLYFLIKFINIRIKIYEGKNDINKHDELTILRTQIGSTIERIIERAMYKTNASRAYVFEFHNGITTLGGLPFLKMTNTYEKLNEGIKSEMLKRENLPMSLFPTFVEAIYSEIWIMLDVSNRKERYAKLVYEILEEEQIKKTVRCKIMDSSKKVIGYLGVDYCKNIPVLDDEYIAGVLIETAIELGALLSVSTKKEVNK